LTLISFCAPLRPVVPSEKQKIKGTQNMPNSKKKSRPKRIKPKTNVTEDFKEEKSSVSVPAVPAVQTPSLLALTPLYSDDLKDRDHPKVSFAIDCYLQVTASVFTCSTTVGKSDPPQIIKIEQETCLSVSLSELLSSAFPKLSQDSFISLSCYDKTKYPNGLPLFVINSIDSSISICDDKNNFVVSSFPQFQLNPVTHCFLLRRLA
jgi:hypothetical protein